MERPWRLSIEHYLSGATCRKSCLQHSSLISLRNMQPQSVVVEWIAGLSTLAVAMFALVTWWNGRQERKQRQAEADARFAVGADIVRRGRQRRVTGGRFGLGRCQRLTGRARPSAACHDCVVAGGSAWRRCRDQARDRTRPARGTGTVDPQAASRAFFRSCTKALRPPAQR